MCHIGLNLSAISHQMESQKWYSHQDSIQITQILGIHTQTIQALATPQAATPQAVQSDQSMGTDQGQAVDQALHAQELFPMICLQSGI